MPDPDEARRIDFTVEGFIVLCDGDGLEIHVTDYHARPLRVSWREMEGWRDGFSGASRIRIRRPPPAVSRVGRTSGRRDAGRARRRR